jgi:hypothetical protein
MTLLYERQRSVINVPPDPYNFGEKDPLKTGALDSSLWELASMRKHYHPSVSTLAKIFEEAFTKPNYNMEDFYDHTYTTVSLSNYFPIVGTRTKVSILYRCLRLRLHVLSRKLRLSRRNQRQEIGSSCFRSEVFLAQGNKKNSVNWSWRRRVM